MCQNLNISNKTIYMAFGLSLVIVACVVTYLADEPKEKMVKHISCPERKTNINAQAAEYFEDVIVYRIKGDKVRLIDSKYGCVISKVTIETEK